MSYLTNLDSEELLLCPYDKTHMVRAKRFQYHLMKCRKNWPGSEFAVCPFNAKHEMPKPELRQHMATCSDRAMLERDIAYELAQKSPGHGLLYKGCTDVPEYSTSSTSGENWEEEMNSRPRIGLDASYFEKFKFVDVSKFKIEEKRNLSEALAAGLNESSEQSEYLGMNTSVKLRLPHKESAASKLSQPPKPEHKSEVFAYSIYMAGLDQQNRASILGRGCTTYAGIGRGLPAAGAPVMQAQASPQSMGVGRGKLSAQLQDYMLKSCEGTMAKGILVDEDAE